MNPSRHIFRQYDIRGIVGQDLDAEIAEAVGRAFGTHVSTIDLVAASCAAWGTAPMALMRAWLARPAPR